LPLDQGTSVRPSGRLPSDLNIIIIIIIIIIIQTGLSSLQYRVWQNKVNAGKLVGGHIKKSITSPPFQQNHISLLS